MDIDENRTVHLTFKTNKAVSETLKFIANKLGKTQPELIEEICIDFIEMINEAAKKDLEKLGYNTSKM